MPTADTCGRTCNCDYFRAGELCDFGESLAKSWRDNDYERDPFGTNADRAADRWERTMP